MTKNVIISALILTLLWFGSAIVRLERYHYASTLGMCGQVDPAGLGSREECLSETETRTSPIYHLLYGLNLL